MAMHKIRQIRDALAMLNPGEVREAAGRSFVLELGATHPERYREMESLLLPAALSKERRAQARQSLYRLGEAPSQPDLRIYEPGMDAPAGAFFFRREQPLQVIYEILGKHPGLQLALASRFHPFREPVTTDIRRSVARENALFSIATAIPSVVPFLSLPWAIGEFASDTAFLTMNQIRMAFLLGGASSRPVGYREQKAEVAGLIAGAFGWRSLARELVGKVPFGGGLIPKAAVAYAGTYVAGLSLERLYRLGYAYTESERHAAYGDAFERGKELAASFLESHRRQPARQ